MPEVAFYVLVSEDEQQRLLFVCKLVEKAYRSGSFCYVRTDTDTQAQKLDDLLWTFRRGSFIPHQLYTGADPSFENVILIGSSEPPLPWQKVIVNVSIQFPEHMDQAERILEIVDDTPEIKSAGRQRYRRYQQLGLTPVTHKV
ncbi:DNA polymerase III subunit chi [Candidatus Methylomicrobium oryzae]|jgi:DNA polymerase-3 subunit chi|uniref:DNA polymerase III subunit chi n=1 Tax=Candidatus Methylomicrobium oryzae TaxID=2802053 RepID=UPI001922D745|nr:DNA polymerase III subunit chi [Methylomicrobium sp. RS1]MBL1262838.1 DNA polymerase III subunit chi [Methylomicrobium sp. RS1]